MRQSPQTTFFACTRSYRLVRIERVLRALAALPNVRLWYSADAETVIPAALPEGVRIAWLQDSATSVVPGEVEFIFLPQPMRGRISLELVCPHETTEGRARG